ncbi:MAG: nucleotidyl transferase AbiEii/AbiGii toxin family protein [Pseudohongiellaceae bacterium]
MAEHYENLSTADQKEILQSAAASIGRAAAVLEKDIWVCWALQALFGIQERHPMAFKGGTSLSKVHGLIDRFSEDVDITLDYRAFDDQGYSKYPDKYEPFGDRANNSQSKKFGERLRGYAIHYVGEVVLPVLEEQVALLSNNDGFELTLEDEGESIHLAYPSVDRRDQYLRPIVRLEFGGRNVIDPNATHIVEPYVKEVTREVIYPSPEVTVLAPERTFWEKATLMHVACNRNKFEQSAERSSRHWYDLSQMSKSETGVAAIENRGLLEDVVRHKKVFFRTGGANYDACLERGLLLVPGEQGLELLRQDYRAMCEAGMMSGDAPSFDEIVESVKMVEDKVNSQTEE